MEALVAFLSLVSFLPSLSPSFPSVSLPVSHRYYLFFPFLLIVLIVVIYHFSFLPFIHYLHGFVFSPHLFLYLSPPPLFLFAKSSLWPSSTASLSSPFFPSLISCLLFFSSLPPSHYLLFTCIFLIRISYIHLFSPSPLLSRFPHLPLLHFPSLIPPSLHPCPFLPPTSSHSFSNFPFPFLPLTPSPLSFPLVCSPLSPSPPAPSVIALSRRILEGAIICLAACWKCHVAHQWPLAGSAAPRVSGDPPARLYFVVICKRCLADECFSELPVYTYCPSNAKEQTLTYT